MMMSLLVAAGLSSAPPDHGALARAFFAAFNARDFAAMEQLYSPDARLTSSDFCSPRGKADIRRTYQRLFDGHPDVKDVVQQMVVQGDRVAVHFHAVSENANMRLPLMTFLRFENGLIVEDDTIFDTGGRPCEK